MIKLSIYANLRENQNIAYCSVCTEKIHCRFSFTYIPHRLHSTESKFHSFLSLNLPNNMGEGYMEDFDSKWLPFHNSFTYYLYTVCNFHEPKFATSAYITALFLRFCTSKFLFNFANHSGSAKSWHVTHFRS